MSTPREIQEGATQGLVLFPTVYSSYINDAIKTLGVYMAYFADVTCMYAKDSGGVHVLRKLQRDLNSIETWR
jgi:hypothetical protein